MVALPSFFTWPFALPTLPSISLPANIQSRFLSYVLKRTLGRFVLTGGLDVDKIQAQISEGWIEIQGLEVDEEVSGLGRPGRKLLIHQSINALIPSSIPLTLTGGRLGLITAKVPFHNLWSDPLSVALDDLVLDFDLVGPRDASGAPARPPRAYQPEAPTTVDLAQSVTSAAGDFVHDELDAFEEAELGNSIRQSVILSQNDPFDQEDVPGGFPFAAASSSRATSPSAPITESKTALAGLVERILARLHVRVKQVTIRIRFVDKDHGATFELRIGAISYADESDSEGPRTGKIVRALRCSSLSIYTVPTRPQPPKSSRPTYAMSSRSSSTSSTVSGPDERVDMAMSMAIADLRQSTMSSVASGASMYHSALDEGEEWADALDGSRARSTTPTAGQCDPEVLLLSLGTDEVVLRVMTTPAAVPAALAESAVSQGRPSPRRTPTSNWADHFPLTELDLALGTLSAVLLPHQTVSLLAAAQAFGQRSTPQSSPDVSAAGQARLEARMQMKGVAVAIIYDTTVPMTETFARAVEQFWAKPSSTYLPVGHLKFRMDRLSASYAAKGYYPSAPSLPRRSTSTVSASRRPSSTVHLEPRSPLLEMSVSEVSVFEYLATDSAVSDSVVDVIPGGAYPVLIFDPHLLKQYDLLSAASARPSSALLPPPLFPEYDSVDWRNSGLQRRSGAGEKAWRVRSGVKGVLKGVSQSAGDDDAPVISVKSPAAASSDTRMSPRLS
jgi:autophagy-related protein 2